MAMTLNEDNLKEAYFKVIKCSGFGAAEKEGEALFPKKVLVSIPEAMHEDIAARFLGCVTRVCVNTPYNWTVENNEPTVDEDTTFKSLWDDWFAEIISN